MSRRSLRPPYERESGGLADDMHAPLAEDVGKEELSASSKGYATEKQLTGKGGIKKHDLFIGYVALKAGTNPERKRRIWRKHGKAILAYADADTCRQGTGQYPVAAREQAGESAAANTRRRWFDQVG